MPVKDYPESYIWHTCTECGHTDCIKGSMPSPFEEGAFMYGSILEFCSECDAMREWPDA